MTRSRPPKLLRGSRIIISFSPLPTQRLTAERSRGRSLQGKQPAGFEPEFRNTGKTTAGRAWSGAPFSFLALTLAVIALLLAFTILYRRMYKVIEAGVETRVGSMRIQSFEIIQAERIRALLAGAVRLARLSMILVIVYTYIHVALTLFPWTRPYAGVLLAYLLLPLKALGKAFLAEIPNLIFVVVLVVITYYVLKLTRLLFAEIERGSIPSPGFIRNGGCPRTRSAVS